MGQVQLTHFIQMILDKEIGELSRLAHKTWALVCTHISLLPSLRCQTLGLRYAIVVRYCLKQYCTVFYNISIHIIKWTSEKKDSPFTNTINHVLWRNTELDQTHSKTAIRYLQKQP